MPGERLSMRQIREVLRLRFAQGLSEGTIGISLRPSTEAVNMYVNRAFRSDPFLLCALPEVAAGCRSNDRLSFVDPPPRLWRGGAGSRRRGDAKQNPVV
jgi:hypothetical protein